MKRFLKHGVPALIALSTIHHPVGGGEPLFHEARIGPRDKGVRP
jgi:hypothetical protein